MNIYLENLKKIILNFIISYGFAFFIGSLTYFLEKDLIPNYRFGFIFIMLFSLFVFELMNFKKLFKISKLLYFTLSSFIYFLHVGILMIMSAKTSTPIFSMLIAVSMNIVLNYLIMISIQSHINKKIVNK
jgi:hypothetical protein